MKITVNIDCTPLEARQFFGLPDVEPMQKSVMTEIERKMLAEMDNFSTEKIMANWLSLAPQNAEWMRQMFDQFTNLATGGGGKPAK
jgi:hypothetical protein